VQWRFQSHPGRAFNIFVQDVVEDRRIQFQWGHTRVQFTFEEIPEGGSRFTIACDGWDATQEGLDDSYSECEGWREVMGSLQQWLKR
jgi:uncharacterized protein YndB with AHSA1/START domain